MLLGNHQQVNDNLFSSEFQASPSAAACFAGFRLLSVIRYLYDCSSLLRFIINLVYKCTWSLPGTIHCCSTMSLSPVQYIPVPGLSITIHCCTWSPWYKTLLLYHVSPWSLGAHNSQLLHLSSVCLPAIIIISSSISSSSSSIIITNMTRLNIV